MLAAFGVADSTPVALAGGRGASWQVGDLVLKPADVGQDELTWHAQTYPHVRLDRFRLPRPQAASDGSLCVAGWCATQFAAGRHEQRRWPEIIAVGARFHAALRGIPRPRFLDTRSSPWAISDRVAWGEIPVGDYPQVPHLRQLSATIEPVSARDQLVHGDISGNVLFHDRLPPAIIDFSPYWRPAAYASAIVVADALVWEGASSDVLGAVSDIGDFGQYLVRALIFRAVTDRICAQDQTSEAEASSARWAPAVDLACQLAARS